MTSVFDRMAIIRFIRPKAKNPLSNTTLVVLKKILEHFNSLSKIEIIIFTGSGDTFAAGADLNEVSQLNEKTALEFGLRGQNLMQTIFNSNKQTIAAIDGYCMGGALDLALSCKYRIASPISVFAHPGAKLGIITGWSGTQILPHLVGKKKALEMFITAKMVDAKEALKIGLIDEISDEPLEQIVRKIGVLKL